MIFPPSPSLPSPPQVVENLVKIVDFLTKGGSTTPDQPASSGPNGTNGAPLQLAGLGGLGGLSSASGDVLVELLPYMPAVAQEILPELGNKLAGRITARFVREVFVPKAAA